MPAAWTILQGDAREQMRSLAAGSFHTVVTSPPYWSLRDYGIPGVSWPDGSVCCYGLEPTIELYLSHTVEICREIRRVLRDDGTLWWNIGDSYSSDWPCARQNKIGNGSLTDGTRAARPSRLGGLKEGDQCLIPHRVALALRADGWYLRSTIVWHKKSPMPESVSGVRWVRHRIKVSRHEYEAMQVVRRSQAARSIQPAGSALQALRERSCQDVPQESAIQGSPGEVSTERGGEGRHENKGSIAKSSRSAAELRRVDGRQGQPGEVSQNGSRESISAEEGCEVSPHAKGEDRVGTGGQAAIKEPGAPEENAGGVEGIPSHSKGEAQKPQARRAEAAEDSGDSRSGNIDAGTMGVDSGSACRSVLLVPEEVQANARSRNPFEQGRATLGEQCGGVLPVVQHRQGGKGFDTVLVDCPGCPKCAANGGYVLKRGRWRPTTAHEYIFLFSKTDGYFCDGEAVKEACSPNTNSKGSNRHHKNGVEGVERQNGSFQSAIGDRVETRNPRSVWTLSSEPFKGSHFATFPSALPRKCIEAATSAAGCCAACGAPYAPVVESERVATRSGEDSKVLKHDVGFGTGSVTGRPTEYGNRDPYRHVAVSRVLGHRPTCDCNAATVPCRVLEPFCGSGTTLQVASQLGRESVGIEQNPEYIEIAKRRIVTPLRKAKASKPAPKPDDRQRNMFEEAEAC